MISGRSLPNALRGHPWRLAVLVAGGIALAIALAAVPADDVYDGIARGIADGAAVPGRLRDARTLPRAVEPAAPAGRRGWSDSGPAGEAARLRRA